MAQSSLICKHRVRKHLRAQSTGLTSCWITRKRGIDLYIAEHGHKGRAQFAAADKDTGGHRYRFKILPHDTFPHSGDRLLIGGRTRTWLSIRIWVRPLLN